MPSYVLPQVLVFQEFLKQPVTLAIPLRACIVGEQFDLHRCSEAAERAGILVTEHYDPDNDTAYDWPGRLPGGIPDFGYTKVCMVGAHLEYFRDEISPDSSLSSSTGPYYGPVRHLAVATAGLRPAKNRIRSPVIVWATANGFDRNADLLRDVKVGDAIRLIGGTGPTTLKTSVIGLLADILDAEVGDPSADDNNQAAHVGASSAVAAAVGSLPNSVDISSASATAYDAYADGDLNEVYTVEVIVGGLPGVAKVKVTSASGKDDQASVDVAAFASPTDIGTRGLTATWDHSASDEFILGTQWTVTVAQHHHQPTLAANAVYTGPADTTYIVEVTRGGKYGATVKPQIKVTTTTGIDVSGPTTVTASGAATAVGTQGVTLSFTQTDSNDGLALGDRYYVAVLAAADGPVHTLVLADNLPDDLIDGTPDLDTTLYIVKGAADDTYSVPANRAGFAPLTNWDQALTQITLNSGFVGYDDGWADGGVPQPLNITDGAVYVQHRDRITTHCSVVGSLDDVADVPAALGKIDPDNPLAFGVYKALLNANGEEVKYLGVCGLATRSGLELEDWLGPGKGLDLLAGRQDVYSLVPLTYDADVQNAFEAHVNAQSTAEAGCWRIGWYNRQVKADSGVYTVSQKAGDPPGTPVLATIADDPDSAGTQYTIVEATGQKFLAAGLRSGDTVRALYQGDGFGAFTYQEFLVDVVVNNETIRLFSGPSAPVTVPAKIEVWRVLDKDEQAAQLAKLPGLFASRRAYLVWPDQVGNAGVTFPGYFLCAALAGLKSGVLPHQGLTNVEIIGFDDLTRTTDYFSPTQLNVMAAAGWWIVTRDPENGAVITRHELSTGDQSDNLIRRQMVTTNVDHISFTFLFTLKSLIGKGNAGPFMVDIIRGECESILQTFKNTTVVARLGPQLQAGSKIRSIGVNATDRSRITAVIDAVVPLSLDNIEIHLQVQ